MLSLRLLGSFLFAFVSITALAQAPASGAARLKADLMVVLAHPDDEISLAATVAKSVLQDGRRAAAVYITRGEGGANMVGRQAGPALGILRETELREAWRQLGVTAVQFLDQADFGYTENLAVSLEKWGHLETLGRLVRQIRARQPEILISWNPAPQPGQHGHHQSAGWLAAEAFEASGKTNWFPEQIQKEGLSPWQPRKLFFTGAVGSGSAPTVTVDLTQPLPDGRNLGTITATAMSEHRSQAFGDIAKSPWWRRMTNQSFTLAKSILDPSIDSVSKGFFQGLPIPDEKATRQLIPPIQRPKHSLRFLGRPSVEIYRDWMQDQALDALLTEFLPDVPVVAGRPSEVRLEMINRTGAAENTLLEFDVPAGWRIDPARSNIRFSANRTNFIIVDVQPPDGLPADAMLVASCRVGGELLSTRARMHPVPRGRVARTGNTLRLDAAPAPSDPWSTLATLPIPSTNTWQGAARDDSDLSALVRVGHDGTHLLVEVEVRDDVVINNLAPNDIQGHWRTDSVEICIDPAAGAEHTFRAFKLGIVPFDRERKVGAARDADFNPGPIAHSAPNSKVASWRTPTGYIVRAIISFTDANIKLDSSRRIGFNVLVYDGDKSDAADGENVNRTRIAWAPRSGVQGRPEDWGRLTLE